MLYFFFKGAYGTVYKGRDLVNKGKFVAMKKIKIPLAQDGVPMTTLREIALLKQLDQQEHPNIVKYILNNAITIWWLYCFLNTVLFRLLDVVHGPRLYNERFMTLYLVFEHIEQDLATYMARCPKPGMSSEIVKVSSMFCIYYKCRCKLYCCFILCYLFHLLVI